MDRNTFTGLFLIMIVLAGSFYFFKPTEAELKKETARIAADSVAKNGTTAPVAPVAAAVTALAPLDSTALKGPFGTNLTGVAQTTELENNHLKLVLTNKGGKILSVEIKNEKTYLGKPLILFSGDDNKFGLKLNVNGKIIKTNDLYFTSQKSGTGVTMRANYSADKYIEYFYDLQPDKNNVTFNINLNGLNQVVQGNAITLNWETILLEQEKSLTRMRIPTTWILRRT
jgi:YidC/Oxa1 family membrane protein insertase